MLSDDFETVCDFAQLKPATIKKILASILSEHPVRAQFILKKLVSEIETL